MFNGLLAGFESLKNTVADWYPDISHRNVSSEDTSLLLYAVAVMAMLVEKLLKE